MTKQEVLDYLQPFMDEVELRVQLEDGSTVPFTLTYAPAIGNQDARIVICPEVPL